jgi:hypothetical protein
VTGVVGVCGVRACVRARAWGVTVYPCVCPGHGRCRARQTSETRLVSRAQLKQKREPLNSHRPNADSYEAVSFTEYTKY